MASENRFCGRKGLGGAFVAIALSACAAEPLQRGASGHAPATPAPRLAREPAPVVPPPSWPAAVARAPARTSRQEVGLASFYWQGQKTASGEVFDRGALTAAHRTLPFNTRVRVTHFQSGRSVVVRINDRGPFKAGRVIDLAEAAAAQIGMTAAGLAHVLVEVLD